MARVTGIGGVFLRARDPEALGKWYVEHLGLQLSPWGGANFLWSDEVPAGTGSTAWNLFPQDTTYFGEGTQHAMLNYRVDDLDGLLLKLRDAGAAIDPKRDDSVYGRFAWVTDPEGNRMELWEPLVKTAE